MKKLILYIAISSLTLSSCNKWLDVKPSDMIESEDMFSKERGFRDALVGCYINMSNKTMYGQDLTMDKFDAMASLWDLSSSGQKDLISLRKFEYESQYAQTTFKSMYSSLYNNIVNINTILANINNENVTFKPATDRELIGGEAYGLRAFTHFEILRIFGQCPIGGTQQVSLPYVEKAGPDRVNSIPFEEYVAKIEADLNKAEELLSKSDPILKYTFEQLSNLDIKNPLQDVDGYSLHRRFRMNYFAVKGLKARLYMYIGKTAAAKKTALEIINAQITGGSSKHIPLAGDVDLDAFHVALPSETLFVVSCFQIAGYAPKMFKDNFTLGKSKLNNDLFKGRQTSANNRYNKVWGVEITSQGSERRVVRKYYQQRDAAENLKDNIKLAYRGFVPVLRLSEIYLIAMEASTDLTEINTLYKEYMRARNEVVVDFASLDAAKAEIINEYRREFYAEGQMFFVYKRLKSPKILWNNTLIQEQNYIVPIPTSELK